MEAAKFTSNSVVKSGVYVTKYLRVPLHRFVCVSVLTCDDIHPARAESASMALTASRTAADQARLSWARSIASDGHSLFHLRMPTTAGPMSRPRSSFSVIAQFFSCPPVRLRHVRGTSGLISSRMNPPGARDRINEDGAATEALARLGAVDVGE